MAFALALELNGKRHYIHTSYGVGVDDAKTTTNQNWAMLFSSESNAVNWRRENSIPMEYAPVFIAMRMERVKSQSTSHKYKKLERGSIEDSMPDFLL